MTDTKTFSEWIIFSNLNIQSFDSINHPIKGVTIKDALDVKITETESDSNNGMVPALFANIPIKDMKHKPDKR